MNPFVILIGIFFLIVIAKAVVIIPENHRGGVVRLGRDFKTVGPGLNVSVPFIDMVTKVDLDASIPGWQGFTEAEDPRQARVRRRRWRGTIYFRTTHSLVAAG